MSDLLRFEKQGIHMSLIDKAFLNGAGYDVALPHILALVRDDSPVDSTFPVCLTYKRFRGALMKYLGALLIPDPPPGALQHSNI